MFNLAETLVVAALVGAAIFLFFVYTAPRETIPADATQPAISLQFLKDVHP